ncbi:YlmC/YmxH family sporulation protein [Brevibacillus sp. B_LB10_24]|jgi:YlmC/YmxH family sporulation protein|uniref:YlmC/YmxH family sporulation protein n=1 Tax=Brevibacillus sp. B_LB10_24 TaxID=3380645 RepID=UPI0038B97CF4
MRFSEICNKEIIGLDNGERMGELRNSDLEIDPGTGEISAIVLPGSSFFGWGKRREDFVIPWKNIVKIGPDTLIVSLRGHADHLS